MIAPPSCRLCAHNERTTVWVRTKPTPERIWNDKCIHPTGPHPMHDSCAWWTPRTEGLPK